MTLEPVPFELREQLDRFMRTLAFRAKEKGLTLRCDVTPDVPDHLIGDWMRLQQVLINLVGNALKFTEEGRVIVTVDMEERTDDEALLHITVADTGIGVPPDRQAAIFEAFTQADGSTARSHGGTGLGLTISRRFVEMMGGRLWLESLPQRGSTFHFTLKIGVRPKAAAPVREHGRGSRRTPAAALRILLAEDNRVNQFLTVRLLEKEGHRVAVGGERTRRARGARRATASISRSWICRCRRWTASRRPRSSVSGSAPAARHLPIIALTANAMVGDAERCLEAGMDGYVSKPIDVRRLLAEINRVQSALHASF